VAKVSADGRFVAFQSQASNLVPGDTNGASDVFVRDRRLRTTVRVDVDSAGAQANGPSLLGAISADGRFVVFGSTATNLAAGDSDAAFDVFVHDRVTGATELVSVNSAEQHQNGASGAMDISANGRYVAFGSDASNLVPGDTNQQPDVFVRDRRAGTTERASVGSGGAQGNGPAGAGFSSVAIDGAGRYVAFESYASNLVPGDGNDTVDVFVRDRAAGTTERVDTTGATLAGLSDDGQHVLFTSIAPGQPGVFVRDRATGRVERVDVSSAGEPSNGAGFGGAINADGRVVAFTSDASNLVPGDANGFSDAFVRDRRASITQRVSVSRGGGEANFNSYPNALSAGGDLLVFESEATNLIRGDTNGASDVFASRVRAAHRQGWLGPRD
jgi:Tol biopolymer transport system component